MFSGLGGQQPQTNTTGGGLFGNPPASSQPQSGGLFSGASGAGSNTQTGATGGLFGGLGGGSTNQTQPKPLLGGLGSSTTPGSSLL